MPLDPNMSDSSRDAIKVLTGIKVPRAGLYQLGHASEIYNSLTQRLKHLEELLALSRSHARRHFDGKTADSYERSLDQFTKGENNYVGSAQDNSTVMSTELFKARANVEYMHMMVIGQFIQLLVEIAWAIATAKFTFGASLKWIPVFKAIRSLAMRRILTWLAFTVPSHQILSQIYASMDSIIQRIQIGKGTRHNKDRELTKSSHLGAIGEGLISAFAALGLDTLFGNNLVNLLKTGLKDLHGLPDPPPLTRTGPDGGPPPPGPLNNTPDTPPGPPNGGPDGPPTGPVKDDPPTGPVKDDPPATNPDRGPDTPTPKDDPTSGPPASPSLNQDLATLFTRHNEELLAPYHPGSPIGAGAFDNAAKAAAAREEFADLFARHFGDHLGESAARNLGRDYANTLTRNWNNPALGQQLRQTIGDRLPPHMRDHLADVPVNLNRPLAEYFSTTGAYAQQTGGTIGSGALEGYLGEGLGSVMDGRGWEASVWSATAGASQAGIQQGATDSALHGLDLFSHRDHTPLPPPQTESNSSAGRGSGAPGNGNGSPLFESGSERWDDGSSGENRGGADREDRGGGREGNSGPDRDSDGQPDRDGPPATASNGTGNRDDVSDTDDVPDLVSDTGSDYGDTDSESGDPDDRDWNTNDNARVRQDEDTRTPLPGSLTTPDPAKDPLGTTDTKHPGTSDDLFHPGMNNGPLAVNFLNAITPDNPGMNTPPGVEQTTPDPGNNGGTNTADRSTPAPEQQHTPAPVTVAPPAGHTTPPPASAPQNPPSDSGQRSTPTERNSGERSPQRTHDTRTPEPSTPQSTGDDPQTVTTDPPPAPETQTTGNTTGQEQPHGSTDEQRANPHTPATSDAPSPADVPLPASPVTESGQPQDTEDTGQSPSERGGEQPEGRDEDTSRDEDRSRDGERDRSGDGNERSGEESGDRSGDGGNRGDGDRSGEEKGDGSDGEEGKGGDREDDAESVHGEDPAEEKDDQEQDGQESRKDAPPATEATTPDTTEGTPVPTRSTATDAPPAPPAAGPDRAADSGPDTPGKAPTDPTASGIDPRADARAASVLDRLPELTRALADNDIPGARALGAEFWRQLRPVEGPDPENRSIHEARTLAQALVYTVSDPSDRRVPLSGESIPAERVRDAEVLARGIGRHLQDRHDPVRARLWQPGGRLTTDYVQYAMQDPADRGPSPYGAPDTVKTVNTALVDGDEDAPAPEGRSEEPPTPPRTATDNEVPAASGSGTIRRLPTVAETDRYGDLLHDPGYNPNAFDTLPTASQDAVSSYTRSSWLNRFARMRPLNEATVQAELDRARDESRSQPGWQVYEIGGGRWPDLARLEEAVERGGLSPEQERIVRGVLDNPYPEAALENLRERSGRAGRIAESLALGGEPAHFPDAPEALALIRRLDRATSQPFPEGFEAVHGMYHHRHLLDGGSTDPHTLAGTTHVEQGYLSVSLGNVPSAAGGSPVDLMRLTVPEGTRGLWVGDRSQHPGEREVILPRGTRYRITAVEPWGRGYLFHAEILPPAHDDGPAAEPPAGTGEVLDRIDRALDADDTAEALAGIREAAERFTADLTSTLRDAAGPGRTAAIDRLEQLRDRAERLADRASEIADTAPEAVAATVALAADLAAAAEGIAARGAADAAAARNAVPEPSEVGPEDPDRITDAARERDTALTRVSDAGTARDDAERASRIAYEAADTAARTARTTGNDAETRVEEAREAAETADARRRAAITAAEDAADRHQSLTRNVNVAASIAVGIALSDAAAARGDADATTAALDRARSIADLASPDSAARTRLNMRMNMLGLSDQVGSNNPLAFAVTDIAGEVRDPDGDGTGMSGADLDSLARGLALTGTGDTEPAPAEAPEPDTDDETTGAAPAETGVSREQETPQDPPATGTVETTEEAVRPPAPPEAETRVPTEEARTRSGEHEEGAPPPPPPPAPTENGGTEPEPSVRPVDTGVTDTEHTPPPSPQHEHDTTAGPVETVDVTGTEQPPPPPRENTDVTTHTVDTAQPPLSQQENTGTTTDTTHTEEAERTPPPPPQQETPRTTTDITRTEDTQQPPPSPPAEPAPTETERPVAAEETRTETEDHEENTPPPPPPPAEPVQTEDHDVETAETPVDTNVTTDPADTEQPPPPPPQENTTTETERPQPDTGNTRQREGPPTRNYPGSVTPDRAEAPYDIGYLLTSSLVNSSMVHAEHLRSFVNDTLTNDAGHVDTAARDAVRERIDEQARRQTGVFFRPEGFSTTVTGADGSRWRADLRLNSSGDGFHHAPTQPERGSESTELKLVDEAGEANPAEGGGNHGGTKFVGLGFQVSPLLLGTVSGTDIGPRFTVSFSGGTRQRQTAETTASVHDSYTSYEIKGKPAVYASDLTMSFDLTPLPRSEDGTDRDNGPADDDAPANGNTPTNNDTPADGNPPADGDAPANNEAPANDPPADRAVNARAESPNGVLLVLPGEVVANAGPQTIRLRDPFATQDHQRGRDDDARPAGPHADKGHPVSVGDIRLSDGSSDKSFPDWIADHLWSPERDRGWWRSVVDTVTPGFVEKRRQEKLDAFRDQIGEVFSEKSVRNNLPKMSSAPAVFTVNDPSGTPRLVSVQSVPTSYEAKPHTIQPAKYIKGNESERTIGTSLRHSDFLGGSLGAGVSVDVGTPGGTHMVRADALSVEGGLRGRGIDESTRLSSGAANRMNYGKTESSAYDVQRNYYVHFDGEPDNVYRFQGDTVEILTVQEARILNGDEPSDKVPVPPAPVRTEGNTTAPPVVDTHETAPNTTGNQRPGNEQGGDTGDGNVRPEGQDQQRGNGQDRERPPAEQPPVEQQPGEQPPAQQPPGEQRAQNERPEGPRPPRPNLDQDQPVTFHGSVPRDFTWPDGSQYRDVNGQQRSIYQQIAHEVLTGLADKRPGLVLPELARDSKNFARRPGHETTSPFTGSTREHRPFRRDHDVAVFNTHRVMDAISASVFKSGEDDLTLHGQPIHLIDSGRFDPSALFKPGKDVLRPPFVAVRVTADFSALRHVGETTRGTGGEYSGSSERSTADGSQTRKTARVTTGAYVRRIDTVDAADNPSDGGVFSVSGQLNSTKGGGQGLGVKTQSEEIIQYAEDSSVWNSTVRFSAKLYENDDLGMVLGGDRPLSERGHDLLDAPIQALATMDTARSVPNGEGGGRDGTAPQATRIRPIPVDQAKEMIDGHTAPAPDSVRKRRDVTGTVKRWFGGGPDRQPPAGRTPAPANGQQETTGDGPRGDGAPPVNPAPRSENNTDTAEQQDTTGNNTTGQQDTTRSTPDLRTPEQRRAELIRDLGPTVEHVNTRFTTDDDNRTGSLLDASYENFSSVPPWEGREGVQRTPGKFGFERKLRHFLVRGQGSRQFYENALSPENLAGNPALQSSGGARTRTEMSGGLLSPHDVRATTATQFDIDSVDRFEQSDGAIVWKDKNTLEVFTREGKRTDVTLLATGGGRYNPNPIQPAEQPAGGTEPAPNSAGAPLIQLGPSAGKSLFDRYTNTRPTSKFSETVEFHPKIPMSYSFSASGRVTQAVEFVKHWSIGPTIPRAARYRGWQAHVRDLVTGLVHIRDAHQSGLVQDKVEETDDGLIRSPQPEPDRPAGVRPRPGFEDSGKMVRPANPDEALQNLADDLASQGWELTKDSRESILHTLNSHTGLNPNTGTPVAVKIRSIDHSIGDLNAPTTAPLSLDATVNLRLDRGDTEVKYLGGKTEYRQRQEWDDGDRLQQGGESSTSAGAQGALLPQLPRPGGDQPGGTTPSSTPYLMGVYGDGSGMNAHGDGQINRDTDKRSIGLTMETPYARVSSGTRLTLDLHISDKQGVANSLTRETPGSGGRRDFTGTGDSGRVEALYPTPYLDLSGTENTTDGTGTTRPTGNRTDTPGGTDTTRPTDNRTDDPGGTDTTRPATDRTDDDNGTATTRPTDGGTTTAGDTTSRTTGGADTRPPGGGRHADNQPPPPENPSHDHHASLSDMMRNWSRATDPGSRGDFRDGVVMPVAVENNGKDVRDLMHVVAAKSLGWNPPANSVRDGRYTPQAITQAAEYTANKLGLNSRNNAIDQSLNAISLKALFPQANAESGTEMIEMGRTTWSVRAVPRPETARIIDFNPSVRLTDSSESSRTFSPFHNESSTATMGVDARPSGRTGTGPPTTAIHYGSANATGSSTSGGDTARGSKPKEPPHSDRVRTGPAYLMEIDTTWGVGVRSEMRGPWYKRSARYVGDRTAAAGRYTAAKVRGVFGDRSAPAPQPSRPARWQRGETPTKITTWVSHGDAVKLGLITPDNAARITPLTERFTNLQKTLGDAEKAYLNARLPLDAAASDRMASPDDPRVQQRYADLESTYEDRLADFNTALRDWETALRELRGNLDDPSSLPAPRPRTVSAPFLDTIQEEPPPPPPPQRNTPGLVDDPAVDPAAIELPERNNRPPGENNRPAEENNRAPERNTGQRGTEPSLLDALGSDFNIHPAESPVPPDGEERTRLDEKGPIHIPGIDGLLGIHQIPRSPEEWNRYFEDLANGRPLPSANEGGLPPHGTDPTDVRTDQRSPDQTETHRTPAPERAEDPADTHTRDSSESLYENSDQEETPHVRLLDRLYPEASTWDRDQRERAARWHLNRRLGPPLLEDDGLSPVDADQTGQRSPHQPEDRPDHGTDTQRDEETHSEESFLDSDDIRRMQIQLARLMSTSPPPADGNEPSPPGTNPTDSREDQRSPAPAEAPPNRDGRPQDESTARPTRPVPEETPDTRPRLLPPDQNEEGSPTLPRDRTDTSRQEGTAPPTEQAPPAPDLFAFFDQELNGPADSGGDRSAQDTTHTPSGQETTAGPVPAANDDGGHETPTPETAPAVTEPDPSLQQPEPGDGETAKDPGHTQDEKEEEKDTEEEAEDAPTDTKDQRKDGEDDGGPDKDGSGGRGGDRTGGNGGSGQDRSGGGGEQGGSSGSGRTSEGDRSGDPGGSGGKDRGKQGTEDRSPHGGRQGGTNHSRGGSPARPDTDSDGYDSADDLPLHDVPDTPVQRPRGSVSDEPQVRPLRNEDGSPSSSVDPKFSDKENGFPEALGTKPFPADFLGLLNPESDFEQPLPSSVTDFPAFPVTGDNGGPWNNPPGRNNDGQGDNQPPASAPPRPA
ncbi:ADP-ribosyltransferase [Nocardiopsis sp. HUAS JQ3]|uniref:ADP-ribosyltransferase n=1 Tax=Nocardiopsis sp. HUAS JQ3 TaxID=3061629 RepID=UPI0023A9CA56|nr:ADP-ribosyltransferase [Nocardiopsis sp. HUAS JQ3]WDZ92958.1 ADP-ribosyltransferase [Nocardiopsis sp. HUAS JQ3]